MAFYFEKFEHRLPPEPVPYSLSRELLWQFLATVALVLGGWYLWWRWSASLNPEALWFAIPLVIAETMAYIGLLLFTFNLWKTEDVPPQPAPASIRDCVSDDEAPERPIAVDVFIATYSEDIELVRLSVRDAKAIRYPHGIDIRVHVLDDGRRADCRRMADEEGVNYFDRPNNIGFKAGNLRSAMERTSGDFLLICDADTRVFPTILERTLGYFRDPRVAWVQTPQWFYDIPEGRRLPDWLSRGIGRPGHWLGRGIEALIGPVKIGEDPLVNEPALFYDVIQRRRNWVNAAFCCGAGSLHRREAVMEAGLKAFGREIAGGVKKLERQIPDETIRRDFADLYRQEAALATEVTPYKFHVSEDIYTSIVLHSDRERRWRSVFHPQIESRMLSPQDLQSWMVQRFKYAGGTLDIALRDDLEHKAHRGMVVLDPVKLVLTNWDEVMGAGHLEPCTQPALPHPPEGVESPTRHFTIGKEVWIEREDFEEVPPKGYKRLFPGNKVRLKGGYVIECTGCTKDANGVITEVLATVVPDTKSGTPGADAVKVKGTITWVENAEPGYMPQDPQAEFAKDVDLTSWIGDWKAPTDDDQVVRSTLGRLLFSGDDIKKSVKVLSGGEKNRMLYGKLMLAHTNVLLMDEPTNHMDMESIEALNTAMDKYKGTLFFVSHDREFVSSIATRILEIKADGIVDFTGNYEDYLLSQGVE